MNAPLGNGPSYKSLGNAQPFKAGKVDAWKSIANPVINSTKQIVMASSELKSASNARKEAAKRAEEKAAKRAVKQSPSQASEPTTTASPSSYGNRMRAATRVRVAQRQALSAATAKPSGSVGMSRPTTFDEIPRYAVNKAMQPQRRKEVNRALSALQYKNHI